MSTTLETAGMTGKIEVVAKAQRRRFSAAEKLRVLGEADECRRPGLPDQRHKGLPTVIAESPR